MPEPAANPTANELHKALRRILKPLIRILLRQGFSIGEFTELVKRTYMEVAWDEFTPDGSKPSDSRVAIMTGLTRKEVKRLRETRDSEDKQSAHQMNRGSRVLSGWYRDPDFCDENGEPRILDLSDDSLGFSTLVKRYSGDMPPRAMLDELVRVGSAQVTEDGSSVTVLSRSFTPGKGDPEHVKIFGSSLADLTRTWDHNLACEARESRYFQGHAYTKKLDKRTFPLLKKMSSEHGQQFLEMAEEWLLAHEIDDESSDDTVEAGIGVYLFKRDGQR